MLTESVVLAILGGVAGLLMAQLALRGLICAGARQNSAPRRGRAQRPGGRRWHWRSRWPPEFSSAWRPRGSPRASTSTACSRRACADRARAIRCAASLVAAQVAIALVLLSGAGLLMRSFYEVAHVDAGFEPEHLMTMRISPAARDQYRGHPELQVQLARGILEKVAAIPGVRHGGDLPPTCRCSAVRSTSCASPAVRRSRPARRRWPTTPR